METILIIVSIILLVLAFFFIRKFIKEKPGVVSPSTPSSEDWNWLIFEMLNSNIESQDELDDFLFKHKKDIEWYNLDRHFIEEKKAAIKELKSTWLH